MTVVDPARSALPSGVRVVAEHPETGSRLAGEQLVVAGVARLRLYPEQPEDQWLPLAELVGRHGWRITAQPLHDDDPLPTEPGAYLDRLGSLWNLIPEGGWFFAATATLYTGARLAEVSRNAPFVPLLTLQAAARRISIQAAREHAASGGRSDLRSDESAVLRRLASGIPLAQQL